MAFEDSCLSFPHASGGNPVSFAFPVSHTKEKSLDSRQKHAGMTYLWGWMLYDCIVAFSVMRRWRLIARIVP